MWHHKSVIGCHHHHQCITYKVYQDIAMAMVLSNCARMSSFLSSLLNISFGICIVCIYILGPLQPPIPSYGLNGPHSLQTVNLSQFSDGEISQMSLLMWDLKMLCLILRSCVLGVCQHLLCHSNKAKCVSHCCTAALKAANCNISSAMQNIVCNLSL